MTPAVRGPALAQRAVIDPRSASARWIVVFLLSMYACQTAIAFGPFPAMRTWLRMAVYVFSLLLLLVGRGPGPRHPAVVPATIALAVVGLSLFHPSTTGYVPGAVHAALYVAILAPLFWVPRLRIDGPMLKRVFAVIWAFHSLSAALGVFQVQFPGVFDPNVSAVIDPDVASASVITNAHGEVVYRAMGISDIPGAAGVSGLYAVAIGTALCVADRRRLVRAIYVLSMTFALTSIYLAQLRSTLLVAALIVAGFVVCLALRRRRRAALTLIVIVLALVASLNIAVLVGGTDVFNRIATLVEERPQNVYYANRGQFLEQTFTEDLPKYPLGAGLARWGMASHYFGGDDPADDGSALWVEIQWTGWLFDGGVPLMLAYSWAVAIAVVVALRLRRRADSASPMFVWASLIVAYDLGAIALTFSYPLFIGEFGLQFWLLNGLLFAAGWREWRESRGTAAMSFIPLMRPAPLAPAPGGRP
jgi:hypothetical protein